MGRKSELAAQPEGVYTESDDKSCPVEKRDDTDCPQSAATDNLSSLVEHEDREDAPHTQPMETSHTEAQATGVRSESPPNQETVEESDGGTDSFWLPCARKRATPETILNDPYAVIDHISTAQCAGMEVNFFECQRIFSSCKERWAEAYGSACEAVNVALEARAIDAEMEDDVELRLERRIKWQLLSPALLLRKPPANGGVKASELEEVCIQRLDQWKGGEWAKNSRSAPRGGP